METKVGDLALILVLLLPTTCINGNNIISVAPVDTVGCYGGISTFYCESDRHNVGKIQWIVDSDLLDEEDDHEELTLRHITISTSPDNTNSTLTIIGLPVNNGIIIRCQVILYNFENDLKGATYTVIDIPPVTDLYINTFQNVTNIDIILSWSPPSYIPLYYQYNIIITDQNSNNTNITAATNTTQYNITISEYDSTNYTVSVIVVDIHYTHYQSVSVNYSIESNTTESVTVMGLSVSSVKFENVDTSSILYVTHLKVVRLTKSVVLSKFTPPIASGHISSSSTMSGNSHKIAQSSVPGSLSTASSSPPSTSMSTTPAATVSASSSSNDYIILYVIGLVGGLVLCIIVSSIIVLGVIVHYRRMKFKGKLILSQERALVRLPRANQHDYEDAQMKCSFAATVSPYSTVELVVPGTFVELPVQGTSREQLTEYFNSREDFLGEGNSGRNHPQQVTITNNQPTAKKHVYSNLPVNELQVSQTLSNSSQNSSPVLTISQSNVPTNIETQKAV